MRQSLSIELRPGQSISIGDEVVLTVEDKSGKVARLRFDAPEDVKIRRKDMSPTNMAVMRARGVLAK